MANHAPIRQLLLTARIRGKKVKKKKPRSQLRTLLIFCEIAWVELVRLPSKAKCTINVKAGARGSPWESASNVPSRWRRSFLFSKAPRGLTLFSVATRKCITCFAILGAKSRSCNGGEAMIWRKRSARCRVVPICAVPIRRCRVDDPFATCRERRSSSLSWVHLRTVPLPY